MVRGVVVFVCCVLGALAHSEAMNPVMMETLAKSVGSIPNLAVQQEYSRRMADLFVGLQVVHNFHMMSLLEIQSETAVSSPRGPVLDHSGATSYDGEVATYFYPGAHDELSDSDSSDEGYYFDRGVYPMARDSSIPHWSYDDSSDSDSSMAQPFDRGMYPMAWESSGMHVYDQSVKPRRSSAFLEEDRDSAMDLEQGDSDADQLDTSFLEITPLFTPGVGPNPSKEELQRSAAMYKFAAVKSLNIQVMMAASDIDKSYWTTQQMMSTVPPQLAMFKVYKNYLNTIALSVALQLHDAFTFEAFMDDFNDKYDAGVSAMQTETLAEQQVFSKWSILAFLKLQLFGLSTYEQMVTAQMLGGSSVPGSSFPGSSVPAYPSNETYAFLEEELKETPSIGPSMGGSIGANFPQWYMTVQYYGKILHVAGLYLELQLAHAGLQQATLRSTGVHVATSTEMHPFAQMHIAGTTMSQGNAIEKLVPRAMSQWTTVQYLRLMLDYYQLYLDLYVPQYSALRETQRQSDAMLNVLVQTDKDAGPQAEEAEATRNLF